MRLSKHGLKRFPEYLEYLNAVTAHDSSLMESSLKRTLERVRAEGTAEELHSSLRTLFQFYCREGNRDEAVAIISELEVNASNEVSVLIEMLFEELGDAVLAEEYVDRYLVVGGWSRSLASDFRHALRLLTLKLRIQVAKGDSRETLDRTVVDLAIASIGQAYWYPTLVDALGTLLERDELHPVAVPIFTALWCGLSRINHLSDTDHSDMLRALDDMSEQLRKTSRRDSGLAD